MPKFKENPNPIKYGKKSSGFKMKSSPYKYWGPKPAVTIQPFGKVGNSGEKPNVKRQIMRAKGL